MLDWLCSRPSPVPILFSSHNFRRLLCHLLLLTSVCHAGTAHPHSLLSSALPQTSPIALYTADVNHDGSPDLVEIDLSINTPTAHILLNDGHGNFTESAEVATAGDSIALGDFSGNGNLDIAWLTVDPSGELVLHVARGRGDGSFLPPVGYNSIAPESSAPSFRPGFLTAAHLDGPGGPYSLLAEDLNHNSLYAFKLDPSTSTVTFRTASLPNGTGPITIADLRHNGTDDVIVSGSAAQVFLADSGTLKLKSTQDFHPSSLNARPRLAAADIDGDGFPDLIAAQNDGSIRVYRGAGDGTFDAALIAEPRTSTPAQDLLAIADIDGDGHPDLLTASPSGLDVYLNLGGQRRLTTTSNPAPGQYTVADFNGDGLADVAIATSKGLTVSFGSPDGTLRYSAAGTKIRTESAPPAPEATTLTSTAVVLALCVQGSVTFPCPVIPGTSPPVVASLSMYFGQVLDGTAAVSASDGTAVSTSSTITFYDGTTAFCTIPVVPSSTCPPSAGVGLESGTHILSATYSGDTTHAPSISNLVTDLVLPDITSATLASSLNPAAFGAAVTFSATLTGNYATPVGPVVFLDGTTPIGTATLNSAGIATITSSTLAAGTHPITAYYAATSDFMAATSGVINEVIVPPVLPATATALTSSLNPSLLGSSVTFTATVSAPGATGPIPTGVITFFDGAAVLGTGALSSTGAATFTTAALAVGNHSITASYPGDTATKASVSAVLVQVVTAPPVVLPSGFTIAVSPTPVTIGVGLSASLLVTITPTGGFNQAVTLGCANLPSEAACTFATGTFSAGAGTTTLQLSTMAPHDCGSAQPYFLGRNTGWSSTLPYGVPALAGLVTLGFGRRKRWLRCLLAILAFATVLHLSGCGNCTDLGTWPGTYTVNVTGTSSGGVTQTQAAVITVKI